MQPLLSILVPVYNVDTYLNECLDSALAQDYENVEIICINDGSTDRSLAILQEYARKDKRIKIIDKANSGYGATMNCGLDAAAGDYVGILESDDFVSSDGWSTLVKHALDHDLDIVKGCYYRTSSKDGDVYFETVRNVDNHCPQVLEEPPYGEVICAAEYPRLFWMNTCMWNGIYRRDYLVREGLRFNETPGASYQDTGFAFKLWVTARRVMLLPDPIVHYRVDNEFSSSNSKEKVFAICDELDTCAGFLRKRRASSWLFEVLCAIRFKSYIWNMQRIASQFRLSFLEKIRTDFQADIDAGYFSRRFFDAADARDYLALANRSHCDEGSTEAASQLEFQVVSASGCATPDVSIIVAFSQHVKSLDACIQSARTQTRQNIELILVGDDPSEASLAVAGQHAERDGRITLIRQTLSGRNVARNIGLRHAKGRYVVFFEPDGVLIPDGIESLVLKADAQNLDVLLFDGSVVREPDEPDVQQSDDFAFVQRQREYGGVRLGANLFSEMENGRDLDMSANLMLVRRELVDAQGLQFEPTIFNADAAWTFAALLGAGRASHLHKAVYVRHVRNEAGGVPQDPVQCVLDHLACLASMRMIAKERIRSFHVNKSACNLFAVVAKHLCRNYRLLNVNDTTRLHGQIDEQSVALLDEVLWQADSVAENDQFREKNTQLEQAVRDTGEELRDVMSSYSMRIGRVATYAPGKIRAALRNDGPHVEHARCPRVLFAAGDARYSGASMSQVALVKELISRGEDVRIALPAQGPLEEVLQQEGISYEIFPSWQWALSVSLEGEELARERAGRESVNNVAIRNMAAYIQKEGIDLVHSNTIGSYIGAAAAKLTGVPSVWHIREFMEEDHDCKFWDQQEAIDLIKSADRCICISQSVYDKFAPLIGESKLEQIYNGIDVDKFYCNREPFGSPSINLAVCANFELGKGQLEAIAAVGMLYNDYGVKNICLNLIGQLFKEDYVAQVEQAIDHSGLTTVVYMPGVRTDMPEFWAHTDIAIIPSRFEAFGRCTVESMLAGAVVVGANTAGTAELISDHQTGYLYKQGDPTDLARVLNEILSDEKTAISVANCGQQFARFEYTSTKNAQEIFELHQRVLAEHKRHK